MSESKITRRKAALLAAGGALAAGALGASADPAAAFQGNMERAISNMYAAIASLRESTPNKGGHRERAMELLRRAIAETQAGIIYADERGGG